MKVAGFEKAWAALLSGGMATAAQVLALWAFSATGAFPSPGPEAIAGAVTGIVASLFAAAGAYLATNSAPADDEPATDTLPEFKRK